MKKLLLLCVMSVTLLLGGCRPHHYGPYHNGGHHGHYDGYDDHKEYESKDQCVLRKMRGRDSEMLPYVKRECERIMNKQQLNN